MALMLVGLVDPLEGILIIGPGAILVTISAFMLKSRVRWWMVVAMGVLVASAAGMAFIPEFWKMVLFFAGWMGDILVLVVLGAFVVRVVIARGRPEAAGRARIAVGLVILLALLGAGRVAVLLSGDRQRIPESEWHQWTTESKDGAAITLSTVVFWGPAGTQLPSGSALTMPGPSGGPSQVTIKNTSDETLELPATAVLDVVVRDDKGAVVYDAAQRFWGGDRVVLPWQRGATLKPGMSTTQVWDIAFEKKGVYLVTAEVHGGPLDGLKTEPVTVTVESNGE